MGASPGNLRDLDPPVPPENYADPHTSELSAGVARIALVLMTELGAFLQMITSDLVHSANLDEASARWSQRLMTLAVMLERAVGRTSAHTGHNNRSLAKIAGTTTVVATSRQERMTQHRNHRASFTHAQLRSRRLTERESEILALSRRGYPPRRIAKRLQLSVETVYTHLRNARRKQRLLDSPASS